MKKYCIFALVLVLAMSMAACSMGGNETTTTTTPSTTSPMATILPTIPTTIEPNIPDTQVDTGSLGDMDGTEDITTDNSDDMRSRK